MDATSGAVQHNTFVTDGNDQSGFGCSIWGSAAIDTDRKLAYVGVGQSYSAPASTLSDSVIAVDYNTAYSSGARSSPPMTSGRPGRETVRTGTSGPASCCTK